MEKLNEVILEETDEHLIKTLDSGLQLGFSSDKFILFVSSFFDKGIFYLFYCIELFYLLLCLPF